MKKEVERERLRKLRRENAVAEGSLIPKDVIAAAIIGKAHGFARILRYELEHNLPALLVGQPIAEKTARRSAARLARPTPSAQPQ